MTIKTTKAYAKRLKLTRTGKLISRGKGQNHFNAKARRRKQLDKRRMVAFKMKRGDIARFFPNA